MTHSDLSKLTVAQIDRAAGVLLATACGDALGAGYEFGDPLPQSTAVGMVGGNGAGWAPGEWTDDTSMAVAIAEVTATGVDLRTAAAQDAIAVRWAGWARDAADVGIQTRAVLSAAGRAPTGVALATAARSHHERTGKSGGNGSLMRTAPVALAYLDDPDGLVEAAHAISALTHYDPEAGEACALWCLAIRHAVLHGTFDGLRLALDTLPSDRRAVWAVRLDEAEANPPSSFNHNGWVVQALQGAWSAITRTAVPDEDPAAGVFEAQHLQLALEAAVRGGRDTDTVAAIAGGLLGARWGVSAVPAPWRRIVHGWPGLRGRDLIRLGVLTARGGQSDGQGWPEGAVFDYSGYGDLEVLSVHPHDAGVRLGAIGALTHLPDDVDAVVSLCRLGADEIPKWGVEPENHVEVWLIDSPDPPANAHLDFVLHDAALAVAALRAEGRTVLVHCVQAQSRTPAVAALYSTLSCGIPTRQAMVDVRQALPESMPNRGFVLALDRLGVLGHEVGDGWGVDVRRTSGRSGDV
ncbi:ADP-ribosylglycohydrolase family protein [Pengzhenrongella phosphoraccumulans]|uniref:ADP-ribosylglycohydrolase family protein n=1 Tax=Pengzhenrongella phosphoraccumulans TaxID=3114394 RepID=UPI00388D4E10